MFATQANQLPDILFSRHWWAQETYPNRHNAKRNAHENGHGHYAILCPGIIPDKVRFVFFFNFFARCKVFFGSRVLFLRVNCFSTQCDVSRDKKSTSWS